MGAFDSIALLSDLALASRTPALASTLLAMTRYMEWPTEGAAQAIACHLDCVAEDEDCDAATRAIAALLARCWLYGGIAENLVDARLAEHARYAD
ncbi:hypothetical protein [Uliginosibacterium sediminicola]|uniref:Uncharacterized protein n=1 Tax=Uliginosibacterium sediminicola TaxID=2024550 RepID=A0ABU9Z1N7_9RHOO